MKRTIAIKIGGKSATPDAVRKLGTEMMELGGEAAFLLVHGGGAEVTRISEKLGIKSVFKDGLRMTSPEEMEVVDMVLSGKMNKDIVRALQSTGLNAVGLSGSDGRTLTGESVAKDEPSCCTGEACASDPRLLRLLLENGYTPVLSSTSMDDAYAGLNCNADNAAFFLAGALPADTLVFISDIPGILSDGLVIGSLSASEVQGKIDGGVITGGMIPKVRSSVGALKQGVRTIVIGEYKTKGDLRRLLDGSAGTKIVA